MSTETLTMDDLQKRLSVFTGTESYHRSMLPGFVCTDGVCALAETAGAYWLIDLVASAQLLPRVRRTEFQVWGITVNPSKSAVVTMREDTDRPVKYRQKMGYTDFPQGEFGWYVQRRVMMLKGEY